MIIQNMCAKEGRDGYNVNASGRRCASTVFIMVISGLICIWCTAWVRVIWVSASSAARSAGSGSKLSRQNSPGRKKLRKKPLHKENGMTFRKKEGHAAVSSGKALLLPAPAASECLLILEENPKDGANMHYTQTISSPLGNVLLSADEVGLTGLWFDGGRYYAETLPKNTLNAKRPF